MTTQSSPLPGLSVVIPVYNSEGSLVPLIERLAAVLRRVAAEWEIILVNDGSGDRSWQTIEGLVRLYPEVRGFHLMRNYGQHNALLAGIRHVRYATTCTLDDDLQNPPEEIPALLAELDKGFDVVYGSPCYEKHGWWRDLASQVTKLTLQGAMGVATARKVSAFRVFRTHLRRAFEDYRSPYVNIDVLLTWGTTRFSAITVDHKPRQSGVSNYTFRKLLTHALNMMTGFSSWPLKVASLVGFAFTLFGIAVLAYVLIRMLLSGRVVPGFAFLASAIAIFSGAQLFALGIIGEYLARMHSRMMERPTYVVGESVGSSENIA